MIRKLLYLSGFVLMFSNPVVIFAQIPDFEIILPEHSRSELMKNREAALLIGVLSPDYRSWVKCAVVFNNDTLPAVCRLKGDLGEHWSSPSQLSYRISMKKGAEVMGMRRFSVQHIQRRNFFNEWIYSRFLKFNGLIGVRFEFVKMKENGLNRGFYCLEEVMDQPILEDNKRMDGPLIKWDDSYYWYILSTRNERWKYVDECFEGYAKSFPDNYSSGDKNTDNLAKVAMKNLLDLKTGKKQGSEVFDLEKTAKLFAIKDVFGTYQHHSLQYTNIRFYYNPVTQKLEPIGFDNEYIDNIEIEGLVGSSNNTYLRPSDSESNWFADVFKDSVLHDQYLHAVEEFIDVKKIDDFKSHIQTEFDRNYSEIHPVHPNVVNLDFLLSKLYFNQIKMGAYLRSNKNMVSAIQEIDQLNNSLKIQVGNISSLPIKINSFSIKSESEMIEKPCTKRLMPKAFKQIPEFNEITLSLPNSYKLNQDQIPEVWVNYSFPGTSFKYSEIVRDFHSDEKVVALEDITQTSLVLIDEKQKTVRFKPGKTAIKKSHFIPLNFTVFIPPGAELDLQNGSVLLSHSPVRAIGLADAPIHILSSDSSGSLQVHAENGYSEFSNVRFVGLKDGSDLSKNWTAALMFSQGTVVFTNCEMIKFKGKMGVEAIHSKVTVQQTLISDMTKDALKFRFSGVELKHVKILNIGEDALISETSVISTDQVLIDIAGKDGIRIKDKSELSGMNTWIKSAKTGLQVNNDSKAQVKWLILENLEVGVEAFSSSEDLSGSNVELIQPSFRNVERNYKTEGFPTLKVDDEYLNSPESKIHNPELTLSEMQKIVQHFPREDNYIKLSLKAFYEKDFEMALESAAMSARLNPANGIAFNNMGAALIELKRWQEAVSILEKAVKIDPSSQLAKNNLDFAKSQLK